MSEVSQTPAALATGSQPIFAAAGGEAIATQPMTCRASAAAFLA